MNFFERQDQAKRKTWYLVILFIMAIACVFLAIHTVIVSTIYASSKGIPYRLLWLSPTYLFYDFCGVAVVIGGASFFKCLEFSSLQGAGIAEYYGGTRVKRNTTNIQERRLLNVVDEMAIAAGIHVPDVYILKNEPSINAFAAGTTPETSAIAVNQGTLDYLTREELQGVIGHEFSHVLHGDTRINMRIIGVLFGLQMIMFFGIFLFRNAYLFNTSRNDERDNGASLALVVFTFGLACTLIGAIGMLFSNLIQAAISRQREFLADASSVQYTRNPEGLVNAFKKIGCPQVGSVVENPRSVEASHLFFSNIFAPGFISSLFSTHPPLTERIRRFDPSFDGVFPPVIKQINWVDRYSNEPARSSNTTQNTTAGGAVAGGTTANGPNIPVPNTVSIAVAGAILADAESNEPITTNGAKTADDNTTTEAKQNTVPVGDAAAVSRVPVPQTAASQKTVQNIAVPVNIDHQMSSIGELDDHKIKIAASLVESIPNALKQAARSLDSACCLIYTLLIDRDATVRHNQLNALSAKLPASDMTRIQHYLPTIDSLSLASRVPLMEIAWPSLKEMDKVAYSAFRALVIELVRSDARVDLFEFTLQHYILDGLDRYFGLAKHTESRYSRITELIGPFSQVLSYLAYVGNNDAVAAVHAFKAALVPMKLQLEIKTRSECTPSAFGQALNQLALATPTLKKNLIHAFYLCIADDGVVTQQEGELMRAIAASLGCPMPSWSGLHA